MRIAMLLPVTLRTLAGSYGSRENMVSLLTEGLVKRGFDITLFVTTNFKTNGKSRAVCERGYEEDKIINPRVRECLHILKLFECADKFDLIHNNFDFLPLTYSALTVTPLVTTIHDIPSSSILPIYKKYNGKVFYVATSSAGRSSELDYLATIYYGKSVETTDKMVEKYIKVYQQVLDKTKREDHRPWGFYQVLANGEGYKNKRIVVYPGKRLSLQRHKKRAEHWYLLQGEAVVTLGEEKIRLTGGQSLDIPRGEVHRIENIGKENLSFIEIQTGDYFGEDDIERLEDDFGRV